METIKTTCCIAGGGPAGIMLGFLLAKAGIQVTILEMHKDFLRDFRGDTIHPSTMEVLKELGLLDAFLQLPHQELHEVRMQFGKQQLIIGDFTHLKATCPFIAFMPQWDFLNFVAEHGRQYPNFHILMETKVEDLIEKEGRIVGVKALQKGETIEVLADLVIGADGRSSTVRERAGLALKNRGAPIDVLWFRLSRLPTDELQPLVHASQGRIVIMINRGDYWQCGYVIAKGSEEQLKKAGIEAFQQELAHINPFLGDRVKQLKTWEDVRLLSVAVNYLPQWYKEGLLCIGDAAHAMSPIGGVGINLAIQDAIATANVLAEAFKKGQVTTKELKIIQNRRSFPAAVIQHLQILIQNNILKKALHEKDEVQPPLAFRVFNAIPFLRRIPAKVIGMGIRPEHVSEQILVSKKL